MNNDTFIIQPKKWTHSELVDKAHTWVLNNTSCGIAFKEIGTASSREQPDVIGFGSGGHSVLIEVKVSRADFLRDKKKSFRKVPSKGMGTQRFYMCPEGIIKEADLPRGWGLIYVYSSGKARAVHKAYKGNIGERNKGLAKNMLAEHGFLYSILRRLHINNALHEKDFKSSKND